MPETEGKYKTREPIVDRNLCESLRLYDLGMAQPRAHLHPLAPRNGENAAKPLQGIVHPAWWHYFKGERLTVAGREVRGFVVPHWAAGVILAAVLSGMGFMYSQMSSQRDMLIRLDTQLQERDKHEIEYRLEFKNQLNVQKVYIDNLMKEVATIKIILTPQQVRQLERTSRKMEN